MKFVVPWIIRMEIDTWIAISPILLMGYYPYTFFTPFVEKHRQRRKRTFTNFKIVDQPAHSVEEVHRIYADLGFKEHY